LLSVAWNFDPFLLLSCGVIGWALGIQPVQNEEAGKDVQIQ